jgi:hypothetical protein
LPALLALLPPSVASAAETDAPVLSVSAGASLPVASAPPGAPARLAGAAAASPASTQEGSLSQRRFQDAVAALEKGAFERAIDQLELLADQGFSHPDVSYDRGVAYVMRARSPQAKAGDLGRAAAAFAEASLLRPSDDDAARALELVQSQIARRRAREGAVPVAARPSLARAVVGLLSEGVWSVGAALGSLLLTVGLALRLFGTGLTTRLAGGIAAPIGAGLLLVCGSLAVAACYYRLTSQPAVVVVGEARLLEENGAALRQVGGAPEHVAIPEGASVYVLERRGTRCRVEWGTIRAWVANSQIRPLAAR